MFIIPGYIIMEVVSSVLPTKKYQIEEKVVHTIGYSVLNMVVWYWLFLIVKQNTQGNFYMYWGCNAFVTIATSFVTGIVLGLIRTKNIIRRFFGLFNVNIEHPIPTAWDYKFSKAESYWVEVTITNGNVIRGVYSKKSFASSDFGYRDIYIEALYVKKEDKWEKVERTAGVWIRPEEIRYIKFYEIEDNRNG